MIKLCLKYLLTCALSVSILLLCFALTGCNPEVAPSSEASNPVAIQSSEASSEKEIDAALNEEETDISREEMSYKDFFSVERKWDTSPGYNSDEEGYYCYLEDGHIYKTLTLDWNPAVDELLLPEQVSSIYNPTKTTYCATVQGQILRFNPDTTGRTVLLDVGGKFTDLIMDLFVGDVLIFFRIGNAIYRYHMPSQTLEQIYQDERLTGLMMPLSNVAIWWTQDNPEWLEYYERTGDVDNAPNYLMGFFYIYNVMTGEQKEITVEKDFKNRVFEYKTLEE